MLIIQIAIGVFIGGLLLTAYKTYVKNKKILLTIQEDRMELLNGIKRHVDNNYQSMFDNYIKIFESRLLTLEDDTNVHFYDVGVIEHKLFTKNLDQLKDKIVRELNANIYAEINDATLSFVKPQLDAYIQQLMLHVGAKSAVMLSTKLLEINEINTAKNAASVEFIN